ncbi:MAG: sortase [Firmicutes bacterium]|nr:sortase [Bacillota bacterium]
MADFENPQPKPASPKSSVEAVLSHVSQVGNTILSLVSGLLAAALILYSSYVLYDTFYTQESAASTPFELLQYRPEIIDDGAVPVSGKQSFSIINDDYRAWLTMYDTKIDYPVMQGSDDLYYASHDVYGQTSLTGAIYMAADNAPDGSDTYYLLYGHHMDNGAMFGGLDDFLDEAYFDSHREGLFVTRTGVYDLTTFAVIRTDAYEDEVYTVGDRIMDVEDFLREMNSSSDGHTQIVLFDEEPLQGAERILALSTCADARTDGRLVVFTVMNRRNLLKLTAEGYEGVYDGQTHGPLKVEVNYPEGTVVSYSTDGGTTWTEGLPSITDVGEMKVLLRAVNEIYGIDTVEVTLTVKPRPLTIQVLDQFKEFGTDDPEWQAEIIGEIVDGFIPIYTISRTNAGTEDVGTYEGVLVAEGQALQGNYLITFVPGDFTIAASGSLAVVADGYEGIYDGKTHGPGRVEVNYPDGTTILYSTDGGATWSTTVPMIKNVGSVTVWIRVENPNYEPAETQVILQVTPAPVTVTAHAASKRSGDPDPSFTAYVEGVVDGFKIQFEIRRADSDESKGLHSGVIVPYGDELQGNYIVTYVAADLTIEAAAVEPRTGDGNLAWALVNLICLILTIYLFVPILKLRDKYGRGKKMRKYNDEMLVLYGTEDDTHFYRLKRFLKRFRIGFCLEILTVAAALIAFILTEDMRLPMVLFDQWTPMMAALLLLCWIIDIRLMRYRDQEPKEADLSSEE